MGTSVKLSEVTLHSPFEIKFGFSGLSEKHAQAIMRDIIRDEWPEQKRPAQSVYTIRLAGGVAVSYVNGVSPVVYIGEGNAFQRLYNHTSWLVPLLIAVPQLRVEIRIIEVARKNNPQLYQNIEADLIAEFHHAHSALPWFNRQREPSKEGFYQYEDDVLKELKKLISVGSGNKFMWAIRPTNINPQYDSYIKGTVQSS